jgi:hypothetical protein
LFSTRVSTTTGFPPLKITLGLYATKLGSGTITSSPGSIVASMAQWSASDTPTVTTISSSSPYFTR